jgi:protein ImuB
VLARRLPAVLLDARGQSVGVSGRAVLTAPPARVGVEDHPPLPVRGWAGPWPLCQRWWAPGAAGRPATGSRLQVVRTDGAAFLLLRWDDRWEVTGVYD